MSLSGVDTAVFRLCCAVDLHCLPQPTTEGCSYTLYYIQANGPRSHQIIWNVIAYDKAFADGILAHR